MKARATIICSRDGKVLLVARTRSRWSLPGGTIKPSESPLDAARRELEEETSLVGAEFTYLFQFGGLNKRHLVFSIGLPQGASPEPCNEISKCRWFSPIKRSMLVTSIPTREIVDLFCTRIAAKRRRLSSTNETGQLPLMSLTASQQVQFKLSRGNS